METNNQHSAVKKKSIVVLISGGGSNLQALIDACRTADFPGQIRAVISNKPNVYGLERATNGGIPAHILEHQKFPSREAFDLALQNLIDGYQPDLVVLAGFMRILTADFVAHYLGRLMNIHPSLLPKYPGLHTHLRAIEAGDSHHGATVHFVTPELDGGPPIVRGEVPILADDTADVLAKRVLVQEHRIYPAAVRWFLEGRLVLGTGGAVLDGQVLPETGVVLSEVADLKPH